MSKVTKKIKEIHEYRETRNIESAKGDFMLSILSNLVNNIGNRSDFFHSQLDTYQKEGKSIDTNMKLISGLYICSLVTCWETFFRELFIFICDYDNEISEKLKSDLTESMSVSY